MSAAYLSYMTVAVTVHALLLSLGGLMAVNALRSLAQVQQIIWNDFPEKERRIQEIGVAKNAIFRLMTINLLIGSFGILLVMLTLIYSPESLHGNYSVEASLIVVSVQLFVFGLMTLWSMRAIGVFVRKPLI